MMRNCIALILLAIVLNGCGSVLAIAGITGPVVQAVNIAEIGKSFYDVAEYSQGNKTSTDRVISFVTDKDCKLSNVLNGDDWCRPYWNDVIYADITGIEY